MARKKLKVTLLAYTKSSEKVVTAAIRQCYSAESGAKIIDKSSKKLTRRLIRQIISSGHTSTVEHASFTFAIEGVSRALTHQLVRHRIASYSQQSQRYVKFDKVDYILPPSIEANSKAKKVFETFIGESAKAYGKLIEMGVKAEDARFVLPNAAETKIVMTMNARALLNFLKERMCTRAQWEIRALANRMYEELLSVAPEIFQYAGPTCETEAICWQGKMHCGKKINRKKQPIEVRERG